MELGLEGKVVLVSGSHRGTGLIIAKHFAREGARVFVHGFTQTQADAACAEIAAGIPVAGDITTDAGADALFAQCARHADTLDVLVNNYGTADRGSWSESTTADWIDAYQKNVLSAQRLIQRALPAMRRRDAGRIINLGTVGSTQPNARSPHYYAAKGALATMTVSLAKELAGTGIRVNLVSPGLILTPEVQAGFEARARREGWGESLQRGASAPMESLQRGASAPVESLQRGASAPVESLQRGASAPVESLQRGASAPVESPQRGASAPLKWKEIEARAAAEIPIRRIPRREEVADFVVFLASARADAIHGQNLRIDGGSLGSLT